MSEDQEIARYNEVVARLGFHVAYGFGEGSPLARLYELDAQVLLLGVGHANNTSLHLAEYRAEYPTKTWCTEASPVIVDGERRWVEYPDLDADDSDFERLGADFGRSGLEHQAAVGIGQSRRRDFTESRAKPVATHYGAELACFPDLDHVALLYSPDVLGRVAAWLFGRAEDRDE